MANESLWVRSNLTSYCEPGAHDFIEVADGDAALRWCARCFKEEPLDASGCLVCDLPGTHTVAMRNVERDLPPLSGRLCDVCFEGFGERGVIRGWRLGPSRGEQAVDRPLRRTQS
ncbi:MAG: hypothetical protein IT304_07210 [Dehalococcoidia bacterium]|nr:hypothetical protein [Dehalococcoidia bacterium]